MRFLLLLLSLVSVNSLLADTLTIGYHVNPPFVIEEDGKLKGSLVKQLNQRFNDEDFLMMYDTVIYQKEEHLSKMLLDVAHSQYDMAIGALSPTSSRNVIVDFTLPFEIGGIGVAYNKQDKWLDINKVIEFSIALVVFLLFIVVIWCFETAHNNQFNSFGDAFYYGIATITTVGYGDKSTKTPGGKLFGSILMLVGVLYIFGQVSSAVTHKFQTNPLHSVESIEDLKHLKVGVVQSSVSQEFLEDNDIRIERQFDNIQQALSRLQKGVHVDVIIHDKFALDYYASPTVGVAPTVLKKDYYSLAVNKENPKLLNIVNEFILNNK